jgi:hypothetical protein
MIVGVYSSHDVEDHITNADYVGRDIHYPVEQKPLAIFKILERLWGMVSTAGRFVPKNRKVKSENHGFIQLVEFAQSNAIEIHMYLHVEKAELAAASVDNRGSSIRLYLDKEKVDYIDEIESPNLDFSHYRDEIHFNDKGQAFLADQLFDYLLPILQSHLKNEQENK